MLSIRHGDVNPRRILGKAVRLTALVALAYAMLSSVDLLPGRVAEMTGMPGIPGVPGLSPGPASVSESLHADPITLSEAYRRVEDGQVSYVNLRPDTYPGGVPRWYGLVQGDGTVDRRWRVQGIDVLLDGIPILSTSKGTVGLNEDEWDGLLHYIALHNAESSLDIAVIDDRERMASDAFPPPAPKVVIP